MNNTNRDICGGCQRQIYTHNKIIVCNACSLISHFDCFQTSMFNLFQNATVTSPAVWHCSDCSRQHGMVRYNPFLEVLSSQDGDDIEWGESADIFKMSEALQNCKAFETVNEFNRDFIGPLRRIINPLFQYFSITLMEIPLILTTLLSK